MNNNGKMMSDKQHGIITAVKIIMKEIIHPIGVKIFAKAIR